MFDVFQKAAEQSKPPFGLSSVSEYWKTRSTHRGVASEFIKTAASGRIPTERHSRPPLLDKVKRKERFSSLLFLNELQGADVCFPDKTARLHVAFDDRG